MIRNKIADGILRYRSRQLTLERERNRALEETNSILSAYLALLVDRRDGVRVPKKSVREAVGKYRATVSQDGADYVISVIGEGFKGSCQ